MEAQPKRCRRCLLQDMADENDYYASVVRYRATMPRRVRTPDAEYTARLEHCRTCPSLNADLHAVRLLCGNARRPHRHALPAG